MDKQVLHKNCLICSEKFYKKPTDSRLAWETECKYCSRSCQWESLKGNKSRLGKNNKDYFGEKHRIWKGDKVSYSALHSWVNRNKGKPKECEQCELSDVSRVYHWANVDGAYQRNLDDFIRLCVPCHSNHDKNLILGIKDRFPEKVGS